MLAEKNENIKKAVGILEELSEDEAVRMIAVAEERAIYDEKVRLEDSHRTGVEEGKAIGAEVAAHKTARKALEMGLEVETAMQLSGLTREEIEKLQKL